ncbi:hypothetical protein FXO37_08916 [Capsicum annuum]|nr:hypothetical protein FXO37_08916 [Capsicum annuum]
MVPFMNNNWLENFEVGFEEAKKFLSGFDSVSTNFGPLSLCFKFCTMADIIATTLILRKGSLRNITCHDVFMLYYLVKKIKINWVTWIREYILESAKKIHVSSNLPYELLITRILLLYSIDLSAYPPIEVAATYDLKMFSSIGYILVEDEWCKKESFRAKDEPLKVSKFVSNPSTSLLKELEELKQRIKGIEKGVRKLLELTTILLDLGKCTSSDISVVGLALDELKQERVKLFSPVLF